MSSETDYKQKTTSSQGLALRTIVILIIAAIVVGTIVAFSYAKVCNQQVTPAGHILGVCRHLEATDPPIIAGGLVVLALLGVFFTEISGFGFTLKREVAQVKNAVADAQGTASSALSSAQVAQRLSLRPPSQQPGPAQNQPLPEKEIRRLASEYDNTRKTMSEGLDRTSKMTSIIADMISVLNDVKPASFNVSTYLESEDEGERLAGYAYLYANPDPRLTQQIAAGLTKDKPFAQYWALRTLRRQLQVDPDCLDLNTKRNLEELLEHLPPATDRAYELRTLLRESST